ncbi:hypothetical protein QFC24_000325 [Naganishia onofrii]|uniref:Uncharacterized protein n=1 Tax=Naganishia onofrii TaxID=1851511 RepID=A0ACC2XVK3_9TREE|nr:hypothetical protein QFC24_000325 [Naganishia onofrii]
MADTHTLGKILERLELLTQGQKDLEKKLIRTFFRRSTINQLESVLTGIPPQPTSPKPLEHASSSFSTFSGSPSLRSGGGIGALMEARRNSRGAGSSPQPSSGLAPLSPSTAMSSVTAAAKNTIKGFMPSSSPTSEAAHIPGASLMEGASTPEMFETLQGAQAGGDGPGKVDDSAKKVNQSGSTSSDIKPGSVEELYPKRAVLTTYPNTFGIAPFPLQWGAETPQSRGPIICSRIPTSLPLRNAIGAHSGSYSIYRALSIAMKLLPSDWRPDLKDTEPPFQIGPHEAWTGKDKNGLPKIVSLDPWGALSQEIWAKEFQDGIDIRPTISQTKAHIKIQEIDELYKSGTLKIDGNIVIKSPELPAFPGVHQGIEVNCFKAALDPVWYLPGVAARLGVQESTLRRALFEDTGGMYPELLTRPDLKVFLPPIGGQTVYIFGNPDYLSDETKELTFRGLRIFERPHDECNGSDVFGSDICTCRPYLIFGIEEAIKCAQRGGVGVLIYFRKEGRALGEVTKYLVYNLRKRTGDSAERYFK